MTAICWKQVKIEIHVWYWVEKELKSPKGVQNIFIFQKVRIEHPTSADYLGLMIIILVSLGLGFATFSVFYPMLKLTIGKYYLFVNFYNQNLGLTRWSNTPLSFRYTTVRQLITQRSGQAVDSTSWQHNTLLVINWLSDLLVMHP